MGTVLVTGIRGFTGAHLARRLEQSGHRVVGLARAVDAAGSPDLVDVEECELDDQPRLVDLVQRFEPDYVVHLAGIAHLERESFDLIYKANLLGTRNLVQALVDSSVPIGHVVLASSANVYGRAYSGMLSEDMPPMPANDYGVSKLAVEQIARIFADRLAITAVRPFNYTGPGQSEAFVIPKLVGFARRKIRQLPLGNIDVERDFSDVRGVVDAYARLLGSDAAIGRILNVCSGTRFSLRSVIALVEELSGHRFEIMEDPRCERDCLSLRQPGGTGEGYRPLGHARPA
jgi:nucleoside-diphosphate-sugar epimerase